MISAGRQATRIAALASTLWIGLAGTVRPPTPRSAQQPVQVPSDLRSPLRTDDPNFPFFDEVHGMYHLMYQDHVCIGPCTGPDIGHVVSRDLVRWARLPVAIWNDRPYDSQAIWTGSATIVDGKPILVYPGMCGANARPAHGCITGFTYAQAVPADPTDPLYTNWTKDTSAGVKIALNPIVQGTGDDPSTAWRTRDGEWRLIGNAKAHGQRKDGVAPIFAAKEFTGKWALVGDTPLPSGECPSLFPLPPLHPGTNLDGAGELPTHVHKRGVSLCIYAYTCMHAYKRGVSFTYRPSNPHPHPHPHLNPSPEPSPEP